MLNIRVEKTTAPKARPTDETKLGFGQIFTDHMAVVDWSSERGLARRAHRSLRLSDPPSRLHLPALRLRNLRGTEGLSPRRRRYSALPPGDERPPHDELRRAPVSAPAARGGFPPDGDRAGAAGGRLGSPQRGHLAVHPPVHVRQRRDAGRARRAPRHLHRHLLSRGQLL